MEAQSLDDLNTHILLHLPQLPTKDGIGIGITAKFVIFFQKRRTPVSIDEAASPGGHREKAANVAQGGKGSSCFSPGGKGKG